MPANDDIEPPVFWEATTERGLIVYQGEAKISVPEKSLPNLALSIVTLLSKKGAE